jgi:hypothetical protein
MGRDRGAAHQLLQHGDGIGGRVFHVLLLAQTKMPDQQAGHFV